MTFLSKKKSHSDLREAVYKKYSSIYGAAFYFASLSIDVSTLGMNCPFHIGMYGRNFGHLPFPTKYLCHPM